MYTCCPPTVSSLNPEPTPSPAGKNYRSCPFSVTDPIALPTNGNVLSNGRLLNFRVLSSLRGSRQGVNSMPRLRLALVLALLVPGVGVAETVVHMPPVGFRYTTKIDSEFTPRPGVANAGASDKSRSVLHHEVVASDGTTIQTRNEGTMSGSAGEFPRTGRTTYRLFFLTETETEQQVPGQPPFTVASTWDCPVDGLDQFYPRGTTAQVSVMCRFTSKIKDQVNGPVPLKVSLSDLGDVRDTTPAGTFDVRKIVVRYSAAEVMNEITYDFAPALGILVVQEAKISSPRGETVTHSEVTEFTAAR
jgi:hypothetical protein